MVTDAQAAAFLVERFGESVHSVCSVGHGEWSEAFTYAIQAGRQYVVRFSALAEDFAKDRVAAGWGSSALPIPPILESGTAFGGFYAISPRALGSYLDVLDRGQLQAALPALFRGLDAARGADISSSAGYGVWGADGVGPHATWRAALLDVAYDRPGHRTHGWRDRLSASPMGDGPFEQALNQLHQLVEACPEQRWLVHSDLLNYNVLVSNDRLSAVIDWGCSLYGDFLYDVAWLAFWSAWYPAWQGIDFAFEAARHYASIGLHVPQLDARLTCYQVHIGLDGQAYNAFKGRWTELEATARRTLEIADQAG
ncbi:MAG: phosphotransferase family protein [Chloroflexota bacterium]